MRDYAETVQAMRYAFEQPCYDCVLGEKCNLGDFCFFKRAADAIEELLAELTTIRKQLPHWTSVEERLPELYAPVLVAYIGYNTGSILSDMTAYRDGDGDWCWYDGDFPSGDMCKVEVTHWMPLPAPPKEDA